MAGITTKDHTLQVGDGTTMTAYVARPAGDGPYPAILVLQEIFGVNAHIRSVADRFAEAGYVALAPELFHRTAPGFQSGYDDFAPGMAQADQLSAEGVAADLKAAYLWLIADPVVDSERIASVGFCMGGRLSCFAATLLDLQAAISFYGRGIDQMLQERADKVKAPLLLFWGGQDASIPPQDIYAAADALRNAGKPFVNVEFADADHGFFCDARGSYEPKAAQQAWTLLQSFLTEQLGSGTVIDE